MKPTRPGVLSPEDLFLHSSGLMIGDNRVEVQKDTAQDLWFRRPDGSQVNISGSPASARVYNSGNISINNNTATALTFDSERYDTDSIHSTGSNTSRLTCKTAGKYQIAGNATWSADPVNAAIYVYLNNTAIIAHEQAVADWRSMAISTEYNLAVDDYVELRVYQVSGGAINIEALSNYSPEFMMARMGPVGTAAPAVGDDHGGLTGLGDDDHNIYLLAAGSRAGSTGTAQDFGSTGMKADVIAESTGAAGVTIDSVPLKDGEVDGVDVSAHDVATTGVHGAGASTLLHSASTVSALTTVGALASGSLAAGFTDVPVAQGGTDRSSHTAYAVICGGTTATAAQQSIAGVGTAGQVLTSNGAGALPTFQAAAAVATDVIWDAAGDLALGTGADTAARLAIGAANSVLWTDGATASWSAAPRLANIADTSGNTRITLQAGAPHVYLTGNVGMGDAYIFASGLETVLRISPSGSRAINWYGIQMFPQVTFTINNRTSIAIWGQGVVNASAGVTGSIVRALNFQAAFQDFLGVTSGAAEITGLATAATVLAFAGASNLTVTDMWGAGIGISIVEMLGGSVTVTNATCLLLTPPNSNRLSNYIGLEILDETAATGNRYLMEVGPAIPYLRCMAGMAAALNETALYIAHGDAGPAWALKQLKTMDPGVGGGNFAGGELVCILV